jgi:hypothetical protein
VGLENQFDQREPGDGHACLLAVQSRLHSLHNTHSLNSARCRSAFGLKTNVYRNADDGVSVGGGWRDVAKAQVRKCHALRRLVINPRRDQRSHASVGDQSGPQALLQSKCKAISHGLPPLARAEPQT